jgi:16S rRNA (adenine1518-N6/adenine1519-N6)-dimethyltransferase
MHALSHPHPKQQLEGTGIRPKHSFGQNFLADEHHLTRITDGILSLAPRGNDPPVVVELGCGLGALTAHLLERGAVVLGVERDRELVPLLRARFADTPLAERLTLIEGNALEVPLDDVPAGFVLCGNLPYHHAADLCLRCVDALPRIGGGCFLIQKEVAARIAASPGGKDYGILSVLLQARFAVDLFHVVPRGAFWPVPDVDGGVLTLAPLPPDQVASDVAFDDLRRVVRAAFSTRRKTLRNALQSAFTAADIDVACAKAGIDPRHRAEVLSVDDYNRLTRALSASPAPIAKS